MAAGPIYNPKASEFDQMGTRLKNILFLQITSLNFDRVVTENTSKSLFLFS